MGESEREIENGKDQALTASRMLEVKVQVSHQN